MGQGVSGQMNSIARSWADPLRCAWSSSGNRHGQILTLLWQLSAAAVVQRSFRGSLTSQRVRRRSKRIKGWLFVIFSS